MNVIFADQKIPTQITKSIFLAGPSPREKQVLDWRIEALKVFQEKNFDGTLFVPIPEGRFYGQDDSSDWTYDNQVDWECAARKISDCIMFWIPRNIGEGMPAFTTNIEFGEDLSTGKVMYGRPDNAEKCRYMDKRILETGNVYNTLSAVIDKSINFVSEGSLRRGTEVSIPLFIWNTEKFQNWMEKIKTSGNQIMSAELIHYQANQEDKPLSFVMLISLMNKNHNQAPPSEYIVF